MGGRFAPCQWALCPRHGTNAHFNIMSIYLNILFKNNTNNAVFRYGQE